MHTFSNSSSSITIITPTYNRSHTLQRLFDSLERQSYQIHQWIVVDDGSSDLTSTLIQSFEKKKKNVVDIKYISQENAGKHIAVNNGLCYATGNYIAIVDSDDCLTDNCIEIFLETLDAYALHESTDIVAVSGSKIDFNGHRISFRSDADVEIMSHHQWFYMLRRTGDRIDFYKREALSNRRFNVFPGEKFLTEDAYWLTIPGKKLFTNREMLQGDYLMDGLTAKYSALLENNPFGMAFYYYVLVGAYQKAACRVPAKTWLALFYYFFRAVGNLSWRGAFFGLFLLPIAMILKKRRK